MKEDTITTSIANTGRLTGLSRTTIYKLIATGQLQTVKIGRRRLVPFAAIQRLLNDGEQSPAPFSPKHELI
ncbi:MAG: DNA-binding protein [Pseudonocardiaceae bacterium]|nr:MAG: DNA-binding protein [Pseudonocardiaceae bacterium]